MAARPMNNHATRNYAIIAIALFLVIAMFLAVAMQPSPSSSGPVYRPGVLVEGVSQDEWLARHWQWTLSLPASGNPGQDVSGRSCANGQSGPVFFIPRNFPSCTVPAGKSILIPIAGTECSTSESVPFTGTTEEELRSCAAQETERYTNIRVTVDGEIVPNITSYRSSSPLFAVSLPEGNVLGAPSGVMWAVADGYQVMLGPLPPGEHEIIVHLELTDGTVLPDKLLRITVVEPAWEVPVTTPQNSTPAVATPVATPVGS
jgi:hypothetical protein